MTVTYRVQEENDIYCIGYNLYRNWQKALTVYDMFLGTKVKSTIGTYTTSFPVPNRYYLMAICVGFIKPNLSIYYYTNDYVSHFPTNRVVKFYTISKVEETIWEIVKDTGIIIFFKAVGASWKIVNKVLDYVGTWRDFNISLPGAPSIKKGNYYRITRYYKENFLYIQIEMWTKKSDYPTVSKRKFNYTYQKYLGL